MIPSEDSVIPGVARVRKSCRVQPELTRSPVRPMGHQKGHPWASSSVWGDDWELSQGWKSYPCPRAWGLFAAAVAELQKELQEEPGAELWLHPTPAAC